jgi:lambda family phage portal protein
LQKFCLIFDFLQNFCVKNMFMSSQRLSGQRDSVLTFGWAPGVPTTGQETLETRDEIAGKAHELWQTNPVAKAIINRLVEKTVVRWQCQCQPEKEILGLDKKQAREHSNKVEAKFRLWWDSTKVDQEGTRTGTDLCRVLLTNVLVHGDCGIRFVRRKKVKEGQSPLKIQLIDGNRFKTPPERIRDENVIAGVEVDPETNGPIAYFIDVAKPNPIGAKVNKPIRFDRYAADETIATDLVFMPTRPSQYRGMSIFAPVINLLKALDDLIAAGVRAEQNRSGVAFAIETTEPEQNDIKELDGNQAAQKARDRAASTEDLPAGNVALAIGKVLRLPENSKFHVIQNTNTAQVLNDLSNLLVMLIGAAVGVPKSILLQVFGSSYSASRGELLEFETKLNILCQLVAQWLAAKAYEYWYEIEVAAGRIEAPGFFLDEEARAAWLGHEWAGSVIGHIDPTKMATFFEICKRNGWCSDERAISGLFGGDQTTESNRIAQEQDDLNELGIAKLFQQVFGMAQNENDSEDDSEDDCDDIKKKGA